VNRRSVLPIATGPAIDPAKPLWSHKQPFGNEKNFAIQRPSIVTAIFLRFSAL
jgi:hypothetical protein